MFNLHIKPATKIQIFYIYFQIIGFKDLIKGFKYEKCAGHAICVAPLMTVPPNLSNGIFLAAVVQWAGAPSCIHHTACLVAHERKVG